MIIGSQLVTLKVVWVNLIRIREPLDAVKGIITSTNKRERWLANGHKELPSEMFGLGLDVNEKGLPPHVFPKKYV